MECRQLGPHQGGGGMIALGCVQGVQGCAGLCFSAQHTLNPRTQPVLGRRVGCAGLSCAQTYEHAVYLQSAHVNEKKGHATPEKACTPYTPYTNQLKRLIYIVFICVGFVLGVVFFVLGSFFRGEGR